MSLYQKIVITALFLYYTVGACCAQTISEPSRLTVKRAKIGGGKAAYYVQIALDQFDVRVLTPLLPALGGKAGTSSVNLDRTPRGFFLRDYMRRYGAVAVSSGGYIDSYSPPTALGLVKSDVVLVSPAHGSWLTEALYCTDVGHASIQPMPKSGAPSEFRDCVQAGPLLLQKAALPALSDRSAAFQKLARSVQEQTFVCIDGAKRVVLGVTEEIGLAALIMFLRELGCVDAMRLTGLDTAGLLVNRELFGNDDYLFPNSLGVIPRRQSAPVR